MDSLSNFYVVAQIAIADGMVINLSIDRMLKEQKNSKSRQDELFYELFLQWRKWVCH